MDTRPPVDRLAGEEADRGRRLEFLGLGDADMARLRELRPLVDEMADDLVDAFYRHILSFDETARFLTDPKRVASLKIAQRRHLIELFAGTYDDAYFESRLAVGRRHAAIGLEPRWYLGGYMVQLQFLSERLLLGFAPDANRAQPYIESVTKVVLLDIGLAMDAYIYGGFVERSLAEAQAVEAERARRALEDREREAERRQKMLSMVVHDIRSPVTAMMATARLGQRRHPDRLEPPGKQFALIEESGANVLGIIDNMVSLSRATEEEMPVEGEAFDVAAVVASCIDELRPFASQTRHALVAECHRPVSCADLDRILVRRIVSNLLVNACRHTPAGSTVIVACTAEAETCSISVTDDGPGLPPAVLEALRAGTLGPRSDGVYVDSGLGLPFCVMACHRLGGTLAVEEPSGRGVRFVISLPLTAR